LKSVSSAKEKLALKQLISPLFNKPKHIDTLRQLL
jgi:hypothetical protein